MKEKTTSHQDPGEIRRTIHRVMAPVHKVGAGLYEELTTTPGDGEPVSWGELATMARDSRAFLEKIGGLWENGDAYAGAQAVLGGIAALAVSLGSPTAPMEGEEARRAADDIMSLCTLSVQLWGGPLSPEAEVAHA